MRLRSSENYLNTLNILKHYRGVFENWKKEGITEEVEVAKSEE